MVVIREQCNYATLHPLSAAHLIVSSSELSNNSALLVKLNDDDDDDDEDETKPLSNSREEVPGAVRTGSK